MERLSVGFFTECYRPIVNGVVASIDVTRTGLRALGVDVTTVAPHFPRALDDVDARVLRIPSLPLPTPTNYRLCVPYVSRNVREGMRGFDVVHAHSPFVTGWMAHAHARRRGVPLVFTYHTRLDAYAHYAPFDPHLTRRAMNELTRRYADAADAVIVPTRATERALREIGVGAPVFVVPSPIDVAQFAGGRRDRALRARLGATEATTPLVLAVARLGREKNLELVLDALAHAPHLRLAIVGDGAHRAALERRARERGVAARTHFAGALAREALPDVYAAADAFVHASTTETQGLVLAEALAAGLPVVAVDAAASREVLADRARFVAPDPASLAAALGDAVRDGRDDCAVQLAYSRFNLGAQARTILAIYRSLIAARAA